MIAGGVLLSAVVMTVASNNLNLAAESINSSEYSTHIQNYLSSGTGADDGDWIIVGNDQYSGVPGNVGIGTTDPQAKLEVNGKILMDSTTESTDSANIVATKGYVDSLQVGVIGATGVNASQVQLRVTGSCSVGSYVTAIAADGTVTCNASTGSWNTSGSDQFSGVSGNVGIGTTAPSQKLVVNGSGLFTGNISASGDVCNGAGNCLSALASLTNACGGAATTYAYAATAYSGSYCLMGSSTPSSPAWPAAGASTSWTCPVSGGSPISCTATHTGAPVNGVCGPAATTYVYSATAFSGALCTTGTVSPASPAFPAAGGSTTWSCLGANGGSSYNCVAARPTQPMLIFGAHSEASCVSAGGTVVIATAPGSAQCRFEGSACPSGWTFSANWTSTSAAYCINAAGSTSYEPPSSHHNWADMSNENEFCVDLCNFGNCINHGADKRRYAAIYQIGCY